ncbi:MAG TPA: hypothetical protein QF772_05465, partial [Nitrospinaceae bacterium]|nr:hypothetical protein [Nitrospinaceae bacterium]
MQNLVQLELIADSRWWWCKSPDAFERFEYDRYGQGYEYLSRVPKTCDQWFFNWVKNVPWNKLEITQKYQFRSIYRVDLYKIGLVKTRVTFGSKAVTFDASCPTKQILDGLQQELNDPSPYMDDVRPRRRFQGCSSTFSVDDIKDLQAFVAKLKQPMDAVSMYLNGELPQTARQQLADFDDSNSDCAAMEVSLTEFLNSIIQGKKSIYEIQRFECVTLRPGTKQMLGKPPEGEAVVRLNRLLLEDAYPLEILRNQKGVFTQKIGDLKSEKYNQFVTLYLPKIKKQVKKGCRTEHLPPDKIYDIVRSFLESDKYKAFRRDLTLRGGIYGVETP